MRKEVDKVALHVRDFGEIIAGAKGDRLPRQRVQERQKRFERHSGLTRSLAYFAASALPSSRPSVMAMPRVRPEIAVEYCTAKRPPLLLPDAYSPRMGL